MSSILHVLLQGHNRKLHATLKQSQNLHYHLHGLQSTLKLQLESFKKVQPCYSKI